MSIVDESGDESGIVTVSISVQSSTMHYTLIMYFARSVDCLAQNTEPYQVHM